MRGGRVGHQATNTNIYTDMDLQMMIEKGLYDLLRRISDDYGLDYDEVCEKYMSTPAPKKGRKAKAATEASEVRMCCAKTAKGAACKKKAQDGSDYCAVHGPKESEGEVSDGGEEVKVCKGKTAKGAACKKKAQEGCEYCKVHAPKEDLREEDEVQEKKKCTGKTAKGKACRKNACAGEEYCMAHKESGPFKLPGEVEHTHDPDETSDDCEACSQYGDPVNSPPKKRKYKVVTRHAAKQVKMDQEQDDEDLTKFAEELQKQMEAEGVL